VNRRQLLAVHGPLLLVAIFWGTNFVALKRILETLTVADTVVVRSILAALCNVVMLVVLRRSIVPVLRRDMPRILLVAILGGVLTPIPNILAQRYIPASVSSLLTTTNPLWTALFAWLVFAEIMADGQADLLQRLFSDAGDFFQLLRCHVGQCFDRSDAGYHQLLDDLLTQFGYLLYRRCGAGVRSRNQSRRHANRTAGRRDI